MPDAPAAAPQRGHELALVLGLHAREDGVVERAAAAAPTAPAGSSAPVVTRPSVSMPAARATAATVAGPSPGDDLDLDAGAVQVGDGRRRVGAHALAQRDERERLRRRAGAARRRPRARRGRACARTAARAGGDPGGRRPRAASAGSELGARRSPRARRARARCRRRTRCRSTSSATRTAPRARPARGAPASCACSASAVGLRAPRLAANAPSSASTSRPSAPASGRTSSTASVPSVSVPVLSRQTTSQPGQRLDGGQPLHERAAPADARGRDGEDEAREQHEALGHERDDARDRGRDGLARGHVVHVQRVQEQGRDRDHERHHEAQQPVDRELQRRELAPVLAREAGELVGVRVGAHALGLVDAAAGDAERARLHASRPRAGRRGRTRR